MVAFSPGDVLAGSFEQTSRVLQRLAEDARLAQHALPDLRKLKPGETPPT